MSDEEARDALRGITPGDTIRLTIEGTYGGLTATSSRAAITPEGHATMHLEIGTIHKVEHVEVWTDGDVVKAADGTVYCYNATWKRWETFGESALTCYDVPARPLTRIIAGEQHAA